MSLLCRQFEGRPELARVAPLVAFAAVTGLQGKLGPDSQYWVYLAKTALGACLIWEMRPCVPEMRWKLSLEAVAVGVAVFALWVGLDGYYPRLSRVEPGAGWNPLGHYGQGSAAAWVCVAARIAGSTLVVPPLEEVFYRSFLYRCLVKADFRAVPFKQFHALSFVVTAFLFGLVHPDRWVAGILCAMAYQGLALRRNRLGDAITAHALTNFLLGLWVAGRGAWSFW